MRFQVVTIFPELLETFAGLGLIGKARAAGRIELETMTPRAYATDRHRSVDDTPYGGGSGMVMRVEPVVAAIEAFDAQAQARGVAPGRRVLLRPGAPAFDQAHAAALSTHPGLVLICGRYEGIDERVSALCDEELSLGDFVLNGGEVAAMAVIEAVARLLPGVLGNAASLHEESHAAEGLLEYPQYTRPHDFRGSVAPPVLLSGNHAAIARWRRGQSLLRTARLRPDLFAQLRLSDEDRRLLAEARAEAERATAGSGPAREGDD